jgi:hypothetical protein
VDRAGGLGQGTLWCRIVHLIQDQNDPHKFISFGSWDGMEAANEWRSSDEFAKNMGACRELCDDFSPGDSTLRAALGT